MSIAIQSGEITVIVASLKPDEDCSVLVQYMLPYSVRRVDLADEIFGQQLSTQYQQQLSTLYMCVVEER